MVEHFVIVGGGQAAAQAVLSLRQGGSTHRLTLISEERVPPYQRPPLSKKYLAGTFERGRLQLRPIEFYEQRQVALELGQRVESIDRAAQKLVLSDGRHFGYDRLLLATGSRVRKLPVPGAELPGVHYIRTIDDADAIRADLAGGGGRVVVVGGGYIGLEAAAVGNAMGFDVTVLEAGSRLMARSVGSDVSRFYAAYHRRAGVAIHCGRAVTELEGRNRVESVLTADGGRFDCDLVIVGVGVEPCAELAAAADLACDDGILVDEFAATSDPAIFAAGDCTRHPNRIVRGTVRLESVQNAIEQAKCAARTLLGQRAAYGEVPWFWSDQYDLKLQIAGLSAGHDRVVLRRGAADNSFAAFYLRSGTLIAVEAVNCPREFMQGKSLIAAGATVPPEAIADPATDLAAFVSS
jgi:3-phenylpropionate/trans-cinnamate dioxygenase ferredoxin reductase component